MKEWFTAAELADTRSPELPASVRNINKLAEGWRKERGKARKAPGKGGGWEYHVSLLPPATQARLVLRYGAAPTAAPAPVEAPSSSLWARFEGLSRAQKDECERRLQAVVDLEEMVRAGAAVTTAASATAKAVGVSVATLFNWRKMTEGVERSDWLAALAPAYTTTAVWADCHPEFWEALKSDWLRLERPAFSASYRRVKRLALKEKWLPIPSERALRRRIEAEVPEGVRILARQGSKKAKALYPAQQRSRSQLHAMQAVNMDGHELDVFVRLDDGKVVRMQLLALQDLYSGKIVGWRLSETENKETVRLAIGDMVATHGIPDRIVLDNGRAFTSKWISGGTPNRYRFKVREGDPQGLLVSLGIEIVWAKPYSGQSKPIERAWRDLAENIAKHPLCAGAYTGNRPDAKPENYGSKAVPIAAFREHVASEIAEHNARPGRRMDSCAGRSFDETFAASMADEGTIVRWPTAAQRSLWLLASDAMQCRKGSGEIHMMENRYWAPALNQHAGKRVVVRFDPDRLQEPLSVYTLDDQFICHAPCIAATGFFDAEAARTHARDRAAYEKALREQRRLTAKMDVDELARLMAGTTPPASSNPTQPRVKRLARGSGAPVVQASEEAFEASFSRGLRLLEAAVDVIPFVRKSD